MIIKCKGYSGELVYVMVDKITDFTDINYNGRSGTRITLLDGREVNVSEYCSDVYDKIRRVRQNYGGVMSTESAKIKEKNT